MVTNMLVKALAKSDFCVGGKVLSSFQEEEVCPISHENCCDILPKTINVNFLGVPKKSQRITKVIIQFLGTINAMAIYPTVIDCHEIPQSALKPLRYKSSANIAITRPDTNVRVFEK